MQAIAKIVSNFLPFLVDVVVYKCELLEIVQKRIGRPEKKNVVLTKDTRRKFSNRGQVVLPP